MPGAIIRLMADIVYILDPDEAVCLELTARLNTFGVQAESYANAAQLLNARSGEPEGRACVLADAGLTGLCDSELWNHFPVILLTAHPDPVVFEQAFPQGPVAVVRKPVETWSLLTPLSRVLRHSPGLVCSDAANVHAGKR